MALAPYFDRAALAAAQVIQGFDPGRFSDLLTSTPIEVSLGKDSSSLPEARLACEVVVRLVARLFPSIRLTGEAESFSDLAVAINPELDMNPPEWSYSIVLGDSSVGTSKRIWVGSKGWLARMSTERPQQFGSTPNPFGGALAGALAVSKLFRAVFVDSDEDWSETVDFSTFELGPSTSVEGPDPQTLRIPARVAVVGLGAVGSATAWVLGRLPAGGVIHLVDPEPLELSNLQRYLLPHFADIDHMKVDLGAKAFSGKWEPVRCPIEWDAFAAAQGHSWDAVLVGVDSARVRRQVQASLPSTIFNAWTQPGDLGVSTHPHLERGACLSCLYLPTGKAKNEDQLIAEALGVPGPQQELAIRTLLFRNDPPPMALLEDVSKSRGLPMELLLPYADRPLRDLYIRGVCGGDVVPLQKLGQPPQDVHVPLAHQSAMAGILLAAAFTRYQLTGDPREATATRINVLRRVGSLITQPIAKDKRRICLCQDEDYRAAYGSKYAGAFGVGRRGSTPEPTDKESVG